MQQKIQLRVDISNDNINPFKVTQYDNMARALEITLINNGIAFTDYTGVTSIVVAFKKNDNKCVTQTVEIPVKGQPIIVPLKAQTLSTPGVLYGQLSLLGANQEKLGTGKFVGTVGEDLAQNAIESSNDWGDLQKAIDLIKNADKFNADENTRRINEDLRIQNENERIANERDRDVNFKQSQLQHENAFDDSQAVRQSTFEASERTRQNTFDNNESARASNDVQLRNQMAELLKVTGTTGTAETELLGAHVDKSGKTYANIGERFDSLDSQLEDNALNSIETDASLTKLNSVVDGNVIVDRVQGRTLVNLLNPTDRIINSNPNSYSLVGAKTQLNGRSIITIVNPSVRVVVLDVEDNGKWVRNVNIAPNSYKVIKFIGTETTQAIYGLFSKGWTKANKNDLLKVMALDGEYTGSMPDYFEGMKSVGEDNGNKIEISTCGKNLFDINKELTPRNPSVTATHTDRTLTIKNSVSGNWQSGKVDYMGLTSGATYVLKVGSVNIVSGYALTAVKDRSGITLDNAEGRDVNNYTAIFKAPSDGLVTICFYCTGQTANTGEVSYTDIQLEAISATPYEPYQTDKSEISLASPLSKYDYIDKDGVHIASSTKIVDHTTPLILHSYSSNGIVNIYNSLKVLGMPDVYGSFREMQLICDKLPQQFLDIAEETNSGVLINETALYIRLKDTLIGVTSSDSDEQKLQKAKNWLQANPLQIVYETATETIEPLNESLILTAFKDGYFGINAGAINPNVSLSFPTTIGGRVDSLEESNYQLKKDYYSTLKTLIKTADDCLKLELSKQNKTDNSLTTASKEIVGSINELNNNKVDKVNGKRLSTNDYDNVEKQEVAKVKELEKYIESLQNDIIPPSMNSNKYRYVRCSATGNTQSGNYVSYSEIKVMDGNTNIAFGCNVIDVLGTIDTGMIKYVTDGKSQKDDPSSSLDLIPSGVGGVTVDLGFPQSFQKIIVYHWVGESRKYNNVKVEVSLDKSKWVTLFNSSTDGGNYTETYEGKTVEVPQNDVNEVIKYNNYCTERLPDNKNNKLRVATFNMHGDNYLNFDAYKNYVTKNLLHFIGLQEVETTKGAIENKFNIYDLNKVVYGKSNTVDVYNAIHSNRSLEAPVVTNLPGTGEGRILVKSSTILNGKKVSLYVTHLSYTEASNRPLQMAKIKEIMDADTTPYKILMGDFNATANDFYNLLGSNYTSIQGYQGNWHETNLDDVYKSIDNIFITKNITINKVVLNPNMMGSDHRMLWAELTLN